MATSALREYDLDVSPTRAVTTARTVASDLLAAIDAGAIDPGGPLAKVVRPRAERFLR